jgi:hypothetical protein
LPLDYRNPPERSAWSGTVRVLLWGVVIMIVAIAVLFGVVAGACMCMK